uniref:Aminopeptidase n=1 Tax=Graphocephala atropunctata TaxID=36148 RepID=A0A1B6M3I9_9HEMI
MTQTPEVLGVMEATTIKPQGLVLSRLTAALLLSAVVLSLVAVALVAYSLAPCHSLDPNNDRLSLQGVPSHRRLYVRLPTSVVPISYKVELIPFIWEGNFTFSGSVTILLNVTQSTDNITLHINDLKVLSHRLMRYSKGMTVAEDREDKVEVTSQSIDLERQFLVLHTGPWLETGQYKLYIEYIGNLNNVLQGFYRSSYKVDNVTRWLAASQFQSTDARRAFPCMDEPALKARFTISIGRPTSMNSISNMPRKRGPPQPVEGIPDYVWDHFEESVPMSTYLVAFVVSDFQHLSDGTFAVWAREQALGQARYALDVGPKILRHFEEYFNIKFPLPKIDMVALPDFSAGAMENWGLITYRETAMLYDQVASTRRNKQRIATVVSHELAHQWFGNLVTPSWWADLWLNEGFASYVECLGVDAVEPSWRIPEQFVVQEMQSVFLLDVYRSSHPISVEVNHPNEIDEIFDTISYGKGASIIRMMDHFLTTPVFRKGLTRYLNKRKYSSATRDDLWQALTDQAQEDSVFDQDMTVKAVMDTWTLQTGFPLVTAIRNYKNRTVTVSQKRFLLGNTSEGDNSLWHIPLTFTNMPQPDFVTTKPSHWLRAEPSLEIQVDADDHHFIMFNIQETGFYRVNYDTNNWKLLIKHLLDVDRFRQIGTLNRAQLLDDALNLARAGVLDYGMALDVTKYLSHELDYLPWKAAFQNFKYLTNMLIKTGGFDRFKSYLLALMKGLYDDTGFVDLSTDSQLKVYSRVEVLKWACQLGHENCISKSVQQFQNWRSSPQPDRDNPISANLKSTVYCTAIREGGLPEWDFAWNRYLHTNVGSEKSLLLGALGCTRVTWILSRFLDRSVTENSGIRKQDAAAVFAAVASNVIGQPLAFEFLRDQWKRLKDYFGGHLFVINNIIQFATARMNTKFDLDTLKAFARAHITDFGGATKVVLQQIEKTEGNVAWMERNYQPIMDWLSQGS